MAAFHADVKRLVEVLFSVSPFRERRADFNVRAIDTPSTDSGVDRPSDGVYRRTALNASYDIFGSERYVLAPDNEAVREAAAQAPYEFVEILVNGEKYGGGGIYNLFATASTRSGSTPYVFVHEFGHHFAALADEYYTSDVAYETAAPTVEPWEPNITALLDPAALKWKDLVEAKTPVPTPWAKEDYEKHSAVYQARAPGPAREPRPRGADGLALRPGPAPGASRSWRGRSTAARSGPSRGRATGEGALPLRRPTASCSPATWTASARSARGPSSGSSTG